MHAKLERDAEVYISLKYLQSTSFSKCVRTSEATKCSCGKSLIVCAKPKSQPYRPITTAKKKKTVLFSAEQAYKYLHSCLRYLSNRRWERRKEQIEKGLPRSDVRDFSLNI